MGIRGMEGWYRGIGMMQCHHLYKLQMVVFSIKTLLNLHFEICSIPERKVWHLGAPLTVSLIKRGNQKSIMTTYIQWSNLHSRENMNFLLE